MRRRIDNKIQETSPPGRTRSLLGTHIPLASVIQTLMVAEYLNFRHAANALGVTQSSVRTRIKVLEERLGIALFERRHRGVRSCHVN
ncbi:LysR family transcriptional regulator [Gluconobacter kondonii]|nr:LysR family transcriptional regulator [Gluconobacter kondonii]